jgi:predicted MFS family arabinose efflux permease
MLLLLCICGFASSLASRSIDPLITSVARDFAAQATSVALLSSAFTLPYSLGQPFLGPLGDALGKAVILRACLWLLAASLAAGALAPTLAPLFATRVIAGAAAGGIVPLMLAMVGDRFPLPERQVAISRVLAAVLIGQLVGATAAGTLAELAGWKGVIGGTAAVATAAAAAATLRLRPRAGAPRAPFRVSEAVERYRLVFRNPSASVCYATVFVEGIAVYGVVPFVAELLEARHAGGPREAGFVIAGIGVGGLVFSALVRPLLQRLGTFGLMRIGGAVIAAGLCVVALGLAWPGEAAAFAVIGFGFFMLHNSLQNRATELAPSARGSAVALHAFFFFLGQAAGPAVFGAGLRLMGASATLLVLAPVIAAAGLLAGRLLQRELSTCRP